MRRRVSRAELQRDPYAIWNSFVEILALSAYEELEESQRVPHLVFWYEHEIQNGGHLQFFENRPAELLEPTVAALQVLGAEIYIPILSAAIGRWNSRRREKLEAVDDYVSAAVEGEFDDLDRAYYATLPAMVRLLENYLDARQDEFVIVDDDAGGLARKPSL